MLRRLLDFGKETLGCLCFHISQIQCGQMEEKKPFPSKGNVFCFSIESFRMGVGAWANWLTQLQIC